MHELFGSQQLIEVDLFYKIERTKNGQTIPVVLSEEDYNKMKANEKQKDSAKSIRTYWKIPTWKAANDMIQAATVYNYHKQDSDVDWNKFRDQRLKTLLVKWDAKGSDGEEIPCNEETINMLHQSIAFALLSKYDDMTKLSKDAEEKNS